MNHAERRALALDVVQWITRWSTWPKHGNAHQAYQAAMKALSENPDIEKYELAKIARRAATARRFGKPT